MHKLNSGIAVFGALSLPMSCHSVPLIFRHKVTSGMHLHFLKTVIFPSDTIRTLSLPISRAQPHTYGTRSLPTSRIFRNILTSSANTFSLNDISS